MQYAAVAAINENIAANDRNAITFISLRFSTEIVA